ncbi:MAG TPA: phosphoribosyltransferase family protein, partial [Thermoanaerobaculia bacterium]|nr:phosphoribosyltransferase family protein [Thermoanaerobaculia bacterium]
KDNVLVVDDVLATGGTLGAAAQLVRGFDANLVACATVIELEFLEGRSKLTNVELHTLLKY